MGCHWRLLNRGRHAMGGSAIHQKKVCIQKIKVRIQENEGASLVIIMHYTMLVVRLNKIKMLLSMDY